VCAGRPQTRNTINDVDSQVEAIHLVNDGQFERRVDVDLFFVSAHMNVVMIPAAVAELVMSDA
jgi:hypothetical protein